MNTLKYLENKFHLDLKQTSPITFFCNRLVDLPIIFKELGFNKGAEIGVLRGDYSEILCQSNPDLKLFSIDAWEFYPVWKNFRRARHYPPIYEEAKNRLSHYPNNQIIKKWSIDAVKDFEDNSLDFVFIDADHRYDSVITDITEWSKKVRSGGIVSGHDYGVKGNFVQVTKAVNNWTKEHHLDTWFILRSPINRHDTCWLWVKQ